jgi:hypothetical protein
MLLIGPHLKWPWLDVFTPSVGYFAWTFGLLAVETHFFFP